MTKIARTNIDGIDYAMSGASQTGTCSSPASDYMKLVTLTDSDSVEDGVTIACTFEHENSAGTAPSSLTLYSTDQIHFYTDAGMTEPYVLAPSGCCELTYTGSGNAYSYISYPVVSVGTHSGVVSAPVCDSHGKITSRSLWKAGDVVFLQYKSRKFFVLNDGTGNSTAGVAFKGTRAEYNTAKLIPEGSDGHIPSGALVIITDEGKTYVTNGTGSSQTLELVANATFNGTHAQWNSLTLTQKAMYNIVNFTDDEAIGLRISDAVEDGNMNPVTSNAVFDYVNARPYSKFQTVEQGQDCNDLTDPTVIYHTQSTMIVQSLNNRPTGYDGEMALVTIPFGVEFSMQIYFAKTDNTHAVFRRVSSRGTWTSWVTF